MNARVADKGILDYHFFTDYFVNGVNSSLLRYDCPQSFQKNGIALKLTFKLEDGFLFSGSSPFSDLFSLS